MNPVLDQIHSCSHFLPMTPPSMLPSKQKWLQRHTVVTYCLGFRLLLLLFYYKYSTTAYSTENQKFWGRKTVVTSCIYLIFSLLTFLAYNSGTTAFIKTLVEWKTQCFIILSLISFFTVSARS